MTRRFDKQGNYVDPTDPLGQQLDTLMARRGIHGITPEPLGTTAHPVSGCGFTMGAESKPLFHGTSMADAMLFGKPTDQVMLPRRQVGTTVEGLRRMVSEMYGMTPEQFATLPHRKQDKIVTKLDLLLERKMRDQHPEALMQNSWNGSVRIDSDSDKGVEARRALHESLRQWAAGPLALERPQGASLHHLIQYDVSKTKGDFAESVMHDASMQSFVVEHDWARATAGTGLDQTTGDWRLPFGECCWEFRVSGVRVLAFTYVDEIRDLTSFWCVYGRDSHWVMDDYIYDIWEGRLTRPRPLQEKGEVHEFPRVARLAFDNIRVACILMDAQVAEREHVPASGTLNKVRLKHRKTPLRDHYVVRLLDRQHRVRVARSAGAGTGGARAPQRGHWRPGTYVHYFDQDSGQEQYVNDGGFILSRSWRRWHFAGDPNNLITKEYRL